MLGESLAVKTNYKYELAFAKFEEWMVTDRRRWDTNPAHRLQREITERDILGWVAYNFMRNLAYSTIKGYVYGVKHAWALRTGIDCFMLAGNKALRIRMILRAVRRLRSKQLNKRDPITLEMISRLAELPETDDYGTVSALTMKTAQVVAFFALLRVGEFTSTAKEFAAELNLSLGDVKFETENGVRRATITINNGKTDLWGTGQSVTVYASGHATLCPVMLLERLLREEPGAEHEPLFMTKTRTPLTRKVFTDTTTRQLTKLGFSTSAIKSHSFRIGGASLLARNGTPAYMIQLLGRWTSDAYMAYIRHCPELFRSTSKALVFDGGLISMHDALGRVHEMKKGDCAGVTDNDCTALLNSFTTTNDN